MSTPMSFKEGLARVFGRDKKDTSAQEKGQPGNVEVLKPKAEVSAKDELLAEYNEKNSEKELNESRFVADVSAECMGKEEEYQDWKVEDRLVSLQDGRIIGVFDGLDSAAYSDDEGHKIYQNHGHKASEAASKSFAETFKNAKIAKTQEDAERAMKEAMFMANARVGLEKSASPEDKGIGTTFVGAEIWRDKKTGESMLTVGNAGDSIAFLYRNGKLERVSKEHSMVGTLNEGYGLGIDDQDNDTFAMTLADYVNTKFKTDNERTKANLAKDLSMPVRKDANTGKMITLGETTIGNLRNITVGGFSGREMSPDEKLDEREASIKTIKLQKGDKILMCSDGLTDSTSQANIEKIIHDYESMGADTVRQALIENGMAAQTDPNNSRANKKDDVTVAWVEFNGFEEPEIELGEADLKEEVAA